MRAVDEAEAPRLTLRFDLPKIAHLRALQSLPSKITKIAMPTPFNQRTFRACLILALTFLLGGCSAHYGIKGHRAHASQKLPASSQYPTLTLEVGKTIRAVTPAKGMLVGGFWLAIYIEDQTIARPLPRKGSFFKGTDIEALRVGKTKAYYGNAVNMESDDALESYRHAHWFWIEVIEPPVSSH